MRRPADARPACAAWLATLTLLLLWAVCSAGMFPFDAVNTADSCSYGLLLLGMATIGVLIARHEPGNAVGWLFSLAPLLVSVSVGVGSYGQWAHTVSGWPGAPLAHWLALWCWATGLIGFAMLLPLLFPDGRPPGSRWRNVVWADLAALGAMAVLLAVQPSSTGDGIANPLGIDAAGSAIVILPVVVAVIALILVGLASSVVRYRRAVGVERLQMREVLWAIVLTFVLFVLNSVTSGHAFVYNLIYALIPLAVGLAMLRYRLYEVDLIIRRTVTYGCLVAAMAAMYLAGVAVIGALLRQVAGQSSALAVAISTLAAAAAFQPLRRRIQRLVDRRFNRVAYDARSAVDAFSDRLREQVDLEALSGDLLDVVSETMQPRAATIWLRPVTMPERPGGTP